MNRAGGFTLLEVLVVLAILGLGAGLVATRLKPGGTGLQVRAAASDFRDLLRAARSSAIGENRTVTVQTVPGGAAFSGGRPFGLAAGLRLGGPPLMAFGPDGSATAARFQLTDGQRVVWVDVDWLTGRVALAEQR